MIISKLDNYLFIKPEKKNINELYQYLLSIKIMTHSIIDLEKINIKADGVIHILSKINNFSGDGILTAIQIAKYCKKKNITLNDLWSIEMQLELQRAKKGFETTNDGKSSFTSLLSEKYQKNSLNLNKSHFFDF